MDLPRPSVVLPEGATECHSHVYDPDRFPFLDPELGEAPHPLETYRAVLIDGLGFSRIVVVQPGAYGADNRCTLDAVARLGLGRARAVVTTAPDVTIDALRDLHRQGARGLRLTTRATQPGRLSLDDAPRLAPLCAELGWHLALQIRDGSVLPDLVDTLAAMPCPVVIDHLGRVPPGPGRLATATHPAFQALLRAVDAGNVWVKVSGLYYSSAFPWPYPDVEQRVRALIEERPDRLIYGQNWPHPRRKPKPDDVKELELFFDFVPDLKTREAILVDNPSRLYFVN